jgi:hypothetical protein
VGEGLGDAIIVVGMGLGTAVAAPLGIADGGPPATRVGTGVGVPPAARAGLADGTGEAVSPE